MSIEVMLMIQVGIGILTAVGVGLIGYFTRKTINLYKCHNNDHKFLKTGMASQMRMQMVDIHETAMEKGKISQFKKQAFYAVYDSYKELGGNGFIESIKEDIDDL